MAPSCRSASTSTACRRDTCPASAHVSDATRRAWRPRPLGAHVALRQEALGARLAVDVLAVEAVLRLARLVARQAPVLAVLVDACAFAARRQTPRAAPRRAARTHRRWAGTRSCATRRTSLRTTSSSRWCRSCRRECCARQAAHARHGSERGAGARRVLRPPGQRDWRWRRFAALAICLCVANREREREITMRKPRSHETRRRTVEGAVLPVPQVVVLQLKRIVAVALHEAHALNERCRLSKRERHTHARARADHEFAVKQMLARAVAEFRVQVKTFSSSSSSCQHLVNSATPTRDETARAQTNRHVVERDVVVVDVCHLQRGARARVGTDTPDLLRFVLRCC